MLPPTCANVTDIGRIPRPFDTLPCAEDATDEEVPRNQQAAENTDERSLSSSANGASTAQADIPKWRPQIDENDPARAPYHRSLSFQPSGVLKHCYPTAYRSVCPLHFVCFAPVCNWEDAVEVQAASRFG